MAARGPRLAWTTAAEGRAHEPRSDLLAGAAWLVLASLDDAARSQTLDDVAELLDAAEAELNPLALALSERTPAELTARLRKALLPKWTAAHSLLHRTWEASDGSLHVRLVSKREPADPERSVGAWAPAAPGTPAARSQFLAWAVSSALLVDACTSSAAAVLAARLRQASSSAIALVVDAPAVAVEPQLLGENEPPRREIEARLRAIPEARLRRGLGSAAPLSLALRNGLPSAPLLDWLDLAPHELLVVPRLSSLHARARFVAEVDDMRQTVAPRGRLVTH